MFKNRMKDASSHINTLRFGLIGVSILVVVLLIIVLVQAQTPPAQRLSLPPDLRYGAQVTAGEINPWEVYAFAGTINQLVHTWNSNAQEEYSDNLGRYSALMTRRYITQKYSDYQERLKRNELQGRQRVVAPMGGYTAENHCGFYHRDCVQVLSPGRWQVWLDVNIKDYQRTTRGNNQAPFLLRDINVRVPIIVIYEPDNTEFNPWGLKLDYEAVNEITTIQVDKK
ncbi:hypothetical protein THIAE_06135 [Thiomicrospira aerophila AL3]|uniref:Integrating conjugative element protein n=1 Tax=Thiomicrospira aerophila AL3 TaxID=717772 RepID=W0DZ86_9GAMM|nr:DUF2895 family protein [Thiomicrospira aerophila]AHF02294.1 hypothetical protein THIAE_06135 [Thiomicrospira aerophila AL3]